MNNVFKKSILIISLALYAVGVGAKTSWFPITAKSNDGTQTLIDVDSIRTCGNFATAWVKRTATDGYYNIFHSIFKCGAQRSIRIMDSV
jgi:hypothetical protein